MTPANTLDRVARFRALDGVGVERLFSYWLQRPELESAIVISFSFDPDLYLETGETQSRVREHLFTGLERLAASAHVTFVTVPPAPSRSRGRAEDRRRRLERLAIAGARVLVHSALHAKVFLFQEKTRLCWVVGSCNLTAAGMRSSSEVSLRGYHPDDFKEIAIEAERIIAASAPL